MIQEVALMGYSGHALVVADILHTTGYKIIGYFEKNVVRTNPLDIPYLGFEYDSDFIAKASNILLFPSIGDNYIRKRVSSFIFEKGLATVSAVSCKSNISSYSDFGNATLICNGACINPFAVIGVGAIINTGAIIEHECIIADYVHIGPGAVLAGNVKVGECSFVGANAVIKQGIKIGKNVLIGAGAVVLNDLPDDEIWVGNPARKIGKND